MKKTELLLILMSIYLGCMAIMTIVKNGIYSSWDFTIVNIANMTL